MYSNIVAFGAPPTFAWLEKYTRHKDNPFAKDVFDPLAKNSNRDNPFAKDVFDPYAKNNQPMKAEGLSVLWCCVVFLLLVLTAVLQLLSHKHFVGEELFCILIPVLGFIYVCRLNEGLDISLTPL